MVTLSVRAAVLGTIFLLGTATTNRVVAEETPAVWNQWRGPRRDGTAPAAVSAAWPNHLAAQSLLRVWRKELEPSYSGPIVSERAVFVTETVRGKTESVRALDRRTGEELWRAQWPGSLTVPFFAAANGSWIRGTPAWDGATLYVPGMRDVLVALDGRTGTELWRFDFIKEFKAPLPTFGYVSSPLIEGEAVYTQAGASVFRLNKQTGKPVWRALQDGGGMQGSAFSSPVLAFLAGQQQLVVQTREKLAGLDLPTGKVLWEQKVPSFRGMNILTPVIADDSVFTSSYQNQSWLFKISRAGTSYQVQEAWSNKAQGYMSTPVLIDGYAYLHLQNQRFTCINLKTGERTWTSIPFGKYCSLVAQGNLILALDQRGELLLLRANPREFELLGRCAVSEQETWAHLAVCGEEVFVRELNALGVYRWQARP